MTASLTVAVLAAEFAPHDPDTPALENAGIDTEPVTFNAYNIIRNRRSYTGTIGSIREHQEMLDFAAEHNITAQIEMIAASQIDEAYQRILDADVRYRVLLDNSTLG